MANHIQDSLDFMRAAGISPQTTHELHSVDFYTSHEALLLEYEEALCRIDSTTGKPIAGSGHMIWIGDRTRQPEGAHVEFCAGVQNPIGLKCGPTTTEDDLKILMDKLNPENEAGRLTLIARFGAGKVGDHLPRLVRTVQSHGANVVWSCDPMHGNTIKSASGFKTRPFDSVLREVQEFFAIHRAEGTVPGGVHFEMTGQDVTECTGGVHAVSEENLSDRYHTACDPRLNRDLAKAMRNARAVGVHDNIIFRAIQYAKQGFTSIEFPIRRAARFASAALEAPSTSTSRVSRIWVSSNAAVSASAAARRRSRWSSIVRSWSSRAGRTADRSTTSTPRQPTSTARPTSRVTGRT